MYFMYLIILSTWILESLTGIPVERSKDMVNGEVVYNMFTKEITALRNEVAALQEKIFNLEFESVNRKEGLIMTEGEKGGKIDNAHGVRKRAAIRRRRMAEVSFQASLTKESATFNLHDTIIFNNVITNIGHAYNNYTGFFTAPLAGTYTFNTNIVSGKGHYIEASIQVNDMPTVAAISDHRVLENKEYFTRWDQGNAVAILSLNRGDKVSVSIQWPRGSHVIHGFGKSSFSGYLVRSHERHRRNR